MASVNNHETQINELKLHKTKTFVCNLYNKIKLCTINMPRASSCVIYLSQTAGYNASVDQAASRCEISVRSDNEAVNSRIAIAATVINGTSELSAIGYTSDGNNNFTIYLETGSYNTGVLVSGEHSSGSIDWYLETISEFPSNLVTDTCQIIELWKKGDVITNACWNDYAERFEKPIGLITEAGDIISLDKSYKDKEIYKLAVEGDTNIAGVHSDEYGMLIGGTEDEEYNKEHFIPVGMIGRVKTKIIGPIHKGDRIVPSKIAGVGRAYKDTDNMFSIVGYATETNLDENIKKVRVKINTY